MRRIKERAYAKLNLTLDLVGVKGGYHMIDSLVTTVNLYDTVTLKARKDGAITLVTRGCGSEKISPFENNAYKAAVAFQEKYSTAGVDIVIQKEIPIGGGLGGSSADAVAVLRGMAKLFGVSDGVGLKEIADALGSDTGYLLHGGFARMRGRGEEVERFSCRLPLYFLLILPQTGVSTAACYQKSDELLALAVKSDEVFALLSKGDWQSAAAHFSNGLYPAAASLNRDVALALAEAQSFSPLGASMTGAGSAAYACFDSAELCEWAKSRYQGKFKTVIVRAISPEDERGYTPFSID